MQLEWEKDKREFGINKIINDLEKASQLSVIQQVQDINSKLKSLASMGAIPESQKSTFDQLMKHLNSQMEDIDKAIK